MEGTLKVCYNEVMRESWKPKENVLRSANSNEFADSLGENHDSSKIARLNFSHEPSLEQRKAEESEHRQADLELDNDLLRLEMMLGENVDTKNYVGQSTKLRELKEDVNYKQEIKLFHDALQKSGKSSVQILKALIENYEDRSEVARWVRNWKNFLQLHEFAKTKPNVEREIIQSFIAEADFSSATSFTQTLGKITKSESISLTTKTELEALFDGEQITSVKGMDRRLKYIAKLKSESEKTIKSEQMKKLVLEKEITELEKKLEQLHPTNPEFKALKDRLDQKKEAKENVAGRIEQIKATIPKSVSFELRDGVAVKRNKDGSRSLTFSNTNLEIKLPSAILPFSGTRNIRAINTSFPYSILKSFGAEYLLYRLPIEKGSIPDRGQRMMGHTILKALGYNDSRILGNEEIVQLKEDLRRLVQLEKTQSTKGNLRALGVINEDGELDKSSLISTLRFVRENRGVSFERYREKIRGRIGAKRN